MRSNTGLLPIMFLSALIPATQTGCGITKLFERGDVFIDRGDGGHFYTPETVQEIDRRQARAEEWRRLTGSELPGLTEEEFEVFKEFLLYKLSTLPQETKAIRGAAIKQSGTVALGSLPETKSQENKTKAYETMTCGIASCDKEHQVKTKPRPNFLNLYFSSNGEIKGLNVSQADAIYEYVKDLKTLKRLKANEAKNPNELIASLKQKLSRVKKRNPKTRVAKSLRRRIDSLNKLVSGMRTNKTLLLKAGVKFKGSIPTNLHGLTEKGGGEHSMTHFKDLGSLGSFMGFGNETYGN